MPRSGVPSTRKTWAVRVVQEEDHEDGQRAGTPLLLRQAEGTALVQSGQEKAVGRSHYGLPVFKGRLETGWKSILYVGR